MGVTLHSIVRRPIARTGRTMRRVIITAILLGILSTACGPPVVLGNIPPSTFHFTTTIPNKDGHPGGWQIAQVLVLLGRLSNFFPRAAVCQVEVGVPVVNADGFVAVEYAQIASAAAADNAAREIMSKREIPTAPACALFRETMLKWLRPPDGPIRGAKVNRFTKSNLPRKSFPPKRGRK